MLLVYWLVLVVWQNISGATARTGVDTLIKAVLIFAFVVFFVSRSNFGIKNIFPILLITILVVLCFLIGGQFTLSGVLAYFYPLFIIVCVFGFGNDFIITKKQLEFLLNGIIMIVLYMVVYALIFCTEQFTGALSLSNAYGNELSSFLVSNHEYGLYLAIATTASIICFEFKHELPIKKRWFYIAVIPIFLINLVLTFSRTSMLGILVILVLYCLFGKKSRLKTLIIIGFFVAAIAIVFVPIIREFVFKIVLKENNLSGRDELAELAMEKFKEANWDQKLFGYGDANIRQIMGSELGHSSTHNAYLQILLGYGLIPLIAMVVFLVCNFISCIKLCKYNQFVGIILSAITLFGAAIMITNTTILFFSPIDSFFLTMFVVIVPKYVGNALLKGGF